MYFVLSLEYIFVSIVFWLREIRAVGKKIIKSKIKIRRRGMDQNASRP
jgi:hypothetical protein